MHFGAAPGGPGGHASTGAKIVNSRGGDSAGQVEGMDGRVVVVGSGAGAVYKGEKGQG